MIKIKIKVKMKIRIKINKKNRKKPENLEKQLQNKGLTKNQQKAKFLNKQIIQKIHLQILNNKMLHNRKSFKII